MIRLANLWSPAAVILAMAFYVWRYGRTDTSVVVFLLVLTVAVVMHTYQLIEDRHRDRERSR